MRDVRTRESAATATGRHRLSGSAGRVLEFAPAGVRLFEIRLRRPEREQRLLVVVRRLGERRLHLERVLEQRRLQAEPVRDHRGLRAHPLEREARRRDLVAGMLDMHVSSVSYRLGVIMKILTVITTIFMPLSLIAGIYGMNFAYLPGKDQPLGFAAVVGGMLTISAGMLWLFRRKGWL